MCCVFLFSMGVRVGGCSLCLAIFILATTSGAEEMCKDADRERTARIGKEIEMISPSRTMTNQIKQQTHMYTAIFRLEISCENIYKWYRLLQSNKK